MQKESAYNLGMAKGSNEEGRIFKSELFSCIRDYATGILRHWTFFFVGICAGLVGLFKDMIWDVPVPTIVWLVVAFLALFYAPFQIYRDQWKEVQSFKQPRPDMTLDQAIQYLTGFGGELDSSDLKKVGPALKKVRELAGLGELTLWGRRQGYRI